MQNLDFVKLNKEKKSKKLILKFSVIFAILTVIFFITAVQAAWSPEKYWVTDSANCPEDYRGVKGGAGTEVCGVDFNNENIYFYDTNSLSVPIASSTTYSANSVSTSTGGYYLDCYSNDGSSPHCDVSGNWYCQRDSSCYSNNRQTTCVAGETASSTCANCRTNYMDCDANTVDCEVYDGQASSTATNVDWDAGCTFICDSGYLDCDGSGDGSDSDCEIDMYDTASSTATHVEYAGTCSTWECEDGWIDCDGDGTGSDGSCEVEQDGICFVGALMGTYIGCSGGSGNCVVASSTFVTGELSEFATDDPLLWGYQYGDGPMIKFTSYNSSTTGGVFLVENDGRVGIGTTTLGSGNLLTVGFDSNSQFIVNNSGEVVSGAWKGDVVGLDYGGLGTNLSDPNADRLLIWDDSSGNITWISTSSLETGTVENSQGGWTPYYSSNGNVLTGTSSIYFDTAGNVAIGPNSYFNSTGYIGIGTTTPDSLLHVAGTGSFNELCFGSDCVTDWSGAGLQGLSPVTGQPAVWVNSNTLTASGTIQTVYGGTGKQSWVSDRLIYSIDTNTLGNISKGGNNTVFYINSSGNYTWTATSSWDTDTQLAEQDITDFGFIKGLTLGNLYDVSTSSLASNDVLYWTGTQWQTTGTSTWDTDTQISDSEVGVFGYIKGLTLGNLYDVSTSSLASNDILYWDGDSWETTATSTWTHDKVTLSGTENYLTISDQEITVSEIDISEHTNLTVSATGLTQNDDDIELTTKYIIPFSASTTNWNNFFDTPSTVITDGAHLTWTDNTLAVDDDWWDNLDEMVLNTGEIYVGYDNIPTGTSTIFVDTSQNYVGIGTTTPDSLLHVAGTGSFNELCFGSDCVTDWSGAGLQGLSP
ncbi:MAG: hypothetical protein U9Q85_01395, partial [Patescibacteria group bacterium]|nr:hypothetical protein [Patescibacteria group bacterium]